MRIPLNTLQAMQSWSQTISTCAGRDESRWTERYGNLIKSTVPNSEELKKTSPMTYFHMFQKSEGKKKAVVYVCGNGEFIGAAFTSLKNLQEEMERLDPSIAVHMYGQDYRGRGTNQITIVREEGEEYQAKYGLPYDPLEPVTEYTPSFKSYPLSTDANDQAKLIQHLVEVEGYALEDILIVGHSLGGNVALWAKDILAQQDSQYHQLNLFISRTFGNILDYKGLGTILSETVKGSILEKCRSSGMAPPKTAWDIANESPHCVVYQSEGDKVIPRNIDLATKLTNPDLVKNGQVHIGKYTGNKKNENTHNSSFAELSAGPASVSVTQLMTAQLTRKPIELDPNERLVDLIHQYELERVRQKEQSGKQKKGIPGLNKIKGYTADEKIEAAKNLQQMIRDKRYEEIIGLGDKRSAYLQGDLKHLHYKLFRMQKKKLPSNILMIIF